MNELTLTELHQFLATCKKRVFVWATINDFKVPLYIPIDNKEFIKYSTPEMKNSKWEVDQTDTSIVYIKPITK